MACARPVWVVWLCVFGYELTAQTAPRDSVYELRTGREIGLLGAGLTINGAAFLISQGVIPLTPVQIDEINSGNIPAFDRGAIRNWSPSAARISDITLLSTVGVVGLTGLPTLRQKKMVYGAADVRRNDAADRWRTGYGKGHNITDPTICL